MRQAVALKTKQLSGQVFQGSSGAASLTAGLLLATTARAGGRSKKAQAAGIQVLQ